MNTHSAPILPYGHSQLVFIPCGQSTQFKLCPISLWTSVSPVSYPMVTHMPHGHSHYALWAFPLYHVAIPNEFLCPVGTRNLSFSAKTYPATTCPVGIPNCCYMPCGHSQSSQFTLCPVCPVVICMPCGLIPITTNMPRGHFPFCPVGIPIPICPVGIPNKLQCPWARATLSFSVKTYPAMTRPVGIPNCCLYALWALPILIFHIVPHMTCGHQLALWAYPHGHQYALWAFPFLPCVHSQQAPMPVGISHSALWAFLFPYALWAFPTSANVPWAPSTLSFSVKICPAMTCPVGFPNGCLCARWAFPILIFHIVPHMTCDSPIKPRGYS